MISVDVDCALKKGIASAAESRKGGSRSRRVRKQKNMTNSKKSYLLKIHPPMSMDKKLLWQRQASSQQKGGPIDTMEPETTIFNKHKRIKTELFGID